MGSSNEGIIMPDSPDKKAEWKHDLQAILKSSRVAEMTFHFPKVDKDKEIITAEAMADALEHYRYLPIIQEFHKERPVGIAEKTWQTANDEFKGIVRFSEDPQVDDVWEKVKRGEYNQVSIAGRRTEFSSECNLHQSQRSLAAPCRTTGLRLDSISVCDAAARNDHTSLSVVKAMTEDPTVFIYTTTLELKQVEDTLIKAETSNSPLIHPVTDGTKRKAGEKGEKMKKCNKPPVEKADEPEEKEEMREEKEKEEKGEAGSPEQEEMEKAPPKEEEKEEEKKAEDPYQEILKLLRELVASDKKVHESMKAEDEKPKDEKEKKVEKAEVPPPVPAEDKTVLTKAEMEQDFKKALDAALAPVLAEIDTLKKANVELAAKLEEYAESPVTKAGIILTQLNVDHQGNPILGNAGAMAAATKPKEAKH
jgi:hypothetical protein